MHGAYLAQQLLNSAISEAEKNKAKKIKKIEISLDANDHISAIDLKYNIKNIIKDTLASNAAIIVKKEGNETFIKDMEVEV